jgi:hypothetical protein
MGNQVSGARKGVSLYRHVAGFHDKSNTNP